MKAAEEVEGKGRAPDTDLMSACAWLQPCPSAAGLALLLLFSVAGLLARDVSRPLYISKLCGK